MIWFKKILFIGLLTGLVGIGIYGGLSSDVFSVHEVLVEEVSSTESSKSSKEIKQRISQSLQKHIGNKIWQLTIEEVTNEVMFEAWVKNVSIRRVYPNKLHVSFEPKSIVFLILSEKGVLKAVAPDGSLLPPPQEVADLEVPFLSGKAFLRKLDLRRKAIRQIEKIPMKGLLSYHSISEILYSKKNGFTAILNNGGIEVLLGENIDEKSIARVQQVLNYTQAKGVNARVIDSRLQKKVLVRLRKGS